MLFQEIEPIFNILPSVFLGLLIFQSRISAPFRPFCLGIIVAEIIKWLPSRIGDEHHLDTCLQSPVDQSLESQRQIVPEAYVGSDQNIKTT
jgi:hypothetical protein